MRVRSGSSPSEFRLPTTATTASHDVLSEKSVRTNSGAYAEVALDGVARTLGVAEHVLLPHLTFGVTHRLRDIDVVAVEAEDDEAGEKWSVTTRSDSSIAPNPPALRPMTTPHSSPNVQVIGCPLAVRTHGTVHPARPRTRVATTSPAAR